MAPRSIRVFTQVNGRKLKPVKDDEPCLLHLVDWNKREGRDATVEDLTLPLHQIGRADIAKVLSKVVHDETTHELHKFFLDDPFKKTARHHGSRLLTEDEEDDDKEESRRPANVHHVKRRPLMLAVFGFTVTLLTTITLICLAYCRTACATVCPKGCVIAFEAIKESCQETLALCKRLANKYVMGREEEARPLNMDKQDYKQREHIVKNIMQPAVAV
nr:hypothetical protein BaRGS_027953 [Batillaria attramentaria]